MNSGEKGGSFGSKIGIVRGLVDLYEALTLDCWDDILRLES